MCEELHDQPSQRAVRTSGFEGEVSTAMEVEGAEALGIGEPLGGVAEAASGAEEASAPLQLAAVQSLATEMFTVGSEA